MEIIRKEIIPALVLTVLIGIIGYALRSFGFFEQLTDLVTPVFILIVLILIIHFYRPVRRKVVIWGAKAELGQDGFDERVIRFKDSLTHLVKAPNGSKISEASGLVGWYPNFENSRFRIQSQLANANSIKLLTYMGKSDIGKGTVFYESIAQNRNAEVRVLLCSENSPYVSPQFAALIGHDVEQAALWKKRILEIQDDIRHLNEYHRVNIVAKLHSIPFSWRIWLIDELLFVTSMMHYKGRKNTEVPVYEIRRSANQIRVFEMFEKFFEVEWDRANEHE